MKNQSTPSQIKLQAESEQDISQDEQLHFTHKQRSLSAESSTSQNLLGGEKELLEHKEKEHSLSDSGVLLGGMDKCGECVRPQAPEFNSGERTDSAQKF